MPYRSTSYEEARFTFVKDGIAQEPDETFEINLVFDDIPEPVLDGVFFLRTKTLIIIDVDSKQRCVLTKCIHTCILVLNN